MLVFSRFAVRATVGLSMMLAAVAPSVADEAVATFKDISKIVAIGGSITEIVYALGEQDRLVARDSTSLFPEAALKLPDVGYMRQLSPEGVLSVNPGGILALEGSGPQEAIDVLKKASVPYIEVPETFDHEGILEKIRAVGAVLGVQEKSAALVAEVDSKLKKAEAQTASIKERKRILFVLSMQGGKIMASGSDTAADGIIRLAGGVNAVEGFSGYKQLADEAVISSRPDVILMMDRSGDHAAADADLFKHPAIAPTPAGEARKVLRMDGSYLLGFGPRTADAIHELAVSLYGDKITD
ncbi:hemin ABC transporter substrate-binding protein [Mesorhizobium sp. Root157]|uniref:heme/hemin ABC transporter substrate-binding protein n=1 Tax=Mesorhizobium sp. Root157 TaxID=1736477 RepID=UPI0007021092|nr:hemin ABC transporter substrate-binding protein [Mesorhizobium sp. Root157]KQZ98494.1 hemin ABC transporter substrate-binding protein [Mesorhizobium sp. Root157]